MPEIRIAEGFPDQRLIVVPGAIVDYARRHPICADLFPTHIGMFQSARHHFISRPEGTAENILIGCLGGSGACVIRDKVWRVSAGNLIFLPANVRHEYFADKLQPWSIFWIHFIGGRTKAYLDQLSIDEQNPLTRASNMASVIDAFEDIYQHTEKGYTDTALLCLSTHLGRFLGVTRTCQRSISLRRQTSEDRVLYIQQVMRDNLNRPLSLSELADIAGWSTAHFSTVFRKQVSVAPMEYFTRLKVQRACTKLKMTRETIAGISASLGYNDSFYFSRLFRRHIGISPTDYRKKYTLITR